MAEILAGEYYFMMTTRLKQSPTWQVRPCRPEFIWPDDGPGTGGPDDDGPSSPRGRDVATTSLTMLLSVLLLLLLLFSRERR